jgi:hypothetical protein
MVSFFLLLLDSWTNIAEKTKPANLTKTKFQRETLPCNYAVLKITGQINTKKGLFIPIKAHRDDLPCNSDGLPLISNPYR